MAQRNVRIAQGVRTVDPVWTRIREEAEDITRREPELASFIFATVLHHDTLESAVAQRVGDRLDHPDIRGELIRQAYDDLFEAEPSVGEAFRADIVAVADRDPATTRYIEPLLYYKGFHALQTHRLAHFLWNKAAGTSRSICRAAHLPCSASTSIRNTRIGRGVFIDHGTGVVIGQTAVIEDDVSILQGVTLGGTGKERGDRHPKIRRGVLLAAGAKVLGNIEVGSCSRVGAGSVVLKSVPPNTTVAGVPARVIGQSSCKDTPAHTMDQMFDMPFSGEGI